MPKSSDASDAAPAVVPRAFILALPSITWLIFCSKLKIVLPNEGRSLPNA